MQNVVKKERNSNLELFRIISMFLIVAHHYVVNSGLASTEYIFSDPLSWKSLFLLLFGGWGKHWDKFLSKFLNVEAKIFDKINIDRK